MQPLNVALIQTSTHWHNPEANRALFEAQFEQLPSHTDLVVLPEMFSTGFSMASEQIAETMQGSTVLWLTEQAQLRDMVICGSLVIVEDGSFYNRFVWVTPTGDITTYDKRHLFRMAGEHEYYASGGRKIVVELKGWRICPMVCYDLRFPAWFRNQMRTTSAESPVSTAMPENGALEYDVLICVANWPAARSAAWRTLLGARAIENQCYVLAVNIVGTDGNGVIYSGESSIIDPAGEVLLHNSGDTQVLQHQLEFSSVETLRNQFPVWQDADPFELS